MRQFWMMLAGVVFAGAAMAAEKSDLARDQAAFSTATAPAMGGIGGDCEALTSMKGTGKVKIGGDVILRYAYSRAKMNDVNAWGGKDTWYASEWEPDTANLDFQIDACDGGKLFISLDFTDTWYNHNGTGGTQQDDLLDQIYFTLENLCGTGFGLTFGKTDIPFGMGRDDLALHPYMSGYGETFLQSERNGWNNAAPFTFNLFETAHSYSYDPRFALIPFFKLGDTLKVEVAMFQDLGNQGWVNSGRQQRFDGRYTNDSGLSFAGRMTWNPIEDLTISASAITRYNRDAGDDIGTFFGLEGKDRTYATSLGFDWKPCFLSKKLDIFAEWQHAWDPEFINNSSSDNIYAGLSFDVTEAITVFAQYEWLRTRYKPTGISAYSQLQRAILAAQYSFASGMYIEAGYQHEWGREKVNNIFAQKGSADVIYTAFGWSF